MDGRPLPAGAPTAAMAAGLALVPEDRRQQGLVMELSDRAQHRPDRAAARCSRGRPDVAARAERDRAADWAVRLQLKYARLADAVGALSGGNQQKVVLAKWLATEPDGADRRRAHPRHRRRHQGRGAPAAVASWPPTGVAVLMISSDLPEVLGMADRVLVMHEGRLAAEIPRAEATEETVMAAATGRTGRSAA